MRRGPRRRIRPAPDKNEPKVNGRIRSPRVLVIDEVGNKLGEFLTEDAVRLANERGLDLIEVAPNGRPPVCKIADYGQLKYDRKKRAAAARKNQVQVQTKEVKVRPKTDEHDMGVKVRHARRFLEAGDKVKVTVRFRGRELAHRDIGAQQCLRVAKECEDLGSIESHPRMDGRQMFMILQPFNKPAPKPSRARKPKKQNSKGAPAEADSAEDTAEAAGEDVAEAQESTSAEVVEPGSSEQAAPETE